jgi:hypothetical protein
MYIVQYAHLDTPPLVFFPSASRDPFFLALLLRYSSIIILWLPPSPPFSVWFHLVYISLVFSSAFRYCYNMHVQHLLWYLPSLCKSLLVDLPFRDTNFLQLENEIQPPLDSFRPSHQSARPTWRVSTFHFPSSKTSLSFKYQNSTLIVAPSFISEALINLIYIRAVQGLGRGKGSIQAVAVHYHYLLSRSILSTFQQGSTGFGAFLMRISMTANVRS